MRLAPVELAARRGCALGLAGCRTRRAQSGMFIWAQLRTRESVSKLWRRAVNQGVLLAPGELFRVDGQATPCWRFNVAQCDAPAMYRFLDALRSA